jgi:hypothetical protein
MFRPDQNFIPSPYFSILPDHGVNVTAINSNPEDTTTGKQFPINVHI